MTKPARIILISVLAPILAVLFVLPSIRLLTAPAPARAEPEQALGTSGNNEYEVYDAPAAYKIFKEEEGGGKNEINIRDFGAKGDCTTNDQPAIQAAFDAIPPEGATVIIPPPGGGCYLISGGDGLYSGLVLNKSNVVIEAHGALLKAPPGSAFIMLHIQGMPDYPINNIRVAGLELDMQKHSLPQVVGANNVQIRYANNVTIDQVKIYNFSFEGIQVKESGTEIIIQNSYFSGGYGDAIHLGDAYIPGHRVGDIQILNNTIEGSYDDGIGITFDVENILIQGNTINTTKIGAGIDLAGVHDVVVDGNTIVNSGQHGVRLLSYLGKDTYNIEIRNNVIKSVSSGHFGINIFNPNLKNKTKPIIIMHNTIETGDAAQGAIYLAGATETIIKDNILNSPSFGIQLDATPEKRTTNFYVRNNTFQNNFVGIFTKNNPYLGAGCVKDNQFINVTTPIDYPDLLIECPKPTGDANGDGKVNGADLEFLKQDYLGEPVHNTDFNSDGRVDCEDFAILQANYSAE